MELRQLALQALACTSWQDKHAVLDAMTPEVTLDPDAALAPARLIPGRPARPVLVSPAELRNRSVATVEGRAILLHALAHIEFNAINLALDAVWRFPGLPVSFYRDWAGVAREESFHFRLLEAHLARLGHDYGDFPAHDGLWDMAERTREDLLARLALVPRTLEARGLDACPLVRHKLASVGDQEGAAIIDIILRDEIGHVALGNKWYRWECARRGIDPVSAYARLAQDYRAPKLKGPLNMKARLAAGFAPEELEAIAPGGTPGRD